MESYKNKLIAFLKTFYKILPLFLGVYCYYPVYLTQDGHQYPLLDAVYEALKLYSGVTDKSVPIGGLLQFARFLALVATLSILVSLFNRAAAVANWLKTCVTDAMAVYGDTEYAEDLYKSLPIKKRIRGGDSFVPGAAVYLLMFEDDMKNIAFLHRHYGQMKGAQIYIMLDSTAGQNIEDPRIHAFSIAENCARQYWREYPVYTNERIAILGTGDITDSILLYGLQVNLIDPDQHLEYHIFGDSREFLREHTEMDQMAPDEIVFHDEFPAYREFAEYDRIILCGDDTANANILLLSRLLAAAPLTKPVYVYAPNGDIISDLFGAERVICFGTADNAASIDMILNEKSMEAARRQHEYYVKRYGGVPWEQLDSFKRYSNVSSSDYMYVTERLIRAGMSEESLARLEHIRWCRYHYLHNWRYAPQTDTARRLHNCLVPFDDLSEEEKKKDIEAILAKKKDQEERL